MMEKISNSLAFGILGLIAIVSIGAGWYLSNKINVDVENKPAVSIPTKRNEAKSNTPKNDGLVCSQEMKTCPDGSLVARTGPNCEFSSCPEIIGIVDKIILSKIKPNDEIVSPVLILGNAVGGWFFEGDFPVEVYDDNNKVLGAHYCSFIQKSENDTWMTEEFVDFRCELEFSKPETESGYILFKKDNPSDIRELDEEFKLPVKFSLHIMSL